MKAQARALLEAAAGRDAERHVPDGLRAVGVSTRRARWSRSSAPGSPGAASRCRPRSATARCWRCRRWPRCSTCCCRKLDFLSIGTNDLTQFLFAADRAHPKLAERYDWLSPAILRFLRRVVRQANAAGVPVGVCGEMGGRTLEAMALIGLGIERLSITPAAVGPIKAMIRSLDVAALRERMPGWLADPPARHARAADRLGGGERREHRLIGRFGACVCDRLRV